MYAGKELGGRNRVPASLEEAVESPEFQAGLAALLTRIAAGEVVAIMCAERDPFNCHRFYLVSYALEERGIEVRHVLETGNAVPTELLEERLIEAYHDGLFQLSLFGEGDVGRMPCVGPMAAATRMWRGSPAKEGPPLKRAGRV